MESFLLPFGGSSTIIGEKAGGHSMKFLFASDSFKGSLTSEQTIQLLTQAAREVFPEAECCGVPIADGGEGTVQAVVSAVGGTLVTTEVHDPLMNKIKATYGIVNGHRAVIEMASASGLPLVPVSSRNPLCTTTYGTGELIVDALDHGCREITIAIGGSSTNDGGMGCMRALGMRFLTKDGKELSGCGRELIEVAHIDTSGLDNSLEKCHITIMCDVNNPLCGENGATYTFAPQKGASPPMLEQLEKGMCHYRDVIRAQWDVDVDAIKGGGAAGGLGIALKVFLGGQMQSGIESVMQLIGFDEKLKEVDLVITGEGRTDRQSICGKVMQGVGLHAQRFGIPCIGLSGSLGEGAEGLFDCGVSSLHSITSHPMSLAYAMEHAATLYYHAAVRLFRTLKMGMLLKS